MAMNARTTTRAFRALRVSFLRISIYSVNCSYSKPAVVRPIVINASRSYASSSEPSLKDTLKELIPAKRELLKKVKAHGDKVIGEVKIENTLGGMRLVPASPMYKNPISNHFYQRSEGHGLGRFRPRCK